MSMNEETYEVVCYFDTYFDGIVKSGISEDEANAMIERLKRRECPNTKHYARRESKDADNKKS